MIRGVRSRMKVCKGCNKNKSFDKFSVSNRYADGKFYKCKTCQNAHLRLFHKNNPGKRKAYRKALKLSKYPQYRAQRSVQEYIRLGRIKKQPCIICKKKKAEAHHNDYRKPFALVWLCKPHHDAWHRLFKTECSK